MELTWLPIGSLFLHASIMFCCRSVTHPAIHPKAHCSCQQESKPMQACWHACVTMAAGMSAILQHQRTRTKL